VDSTTDNIVRLGQFAYKDVDSTPRYLSQFDSHIYWNTEQTGFKTIDLSQQSSQESGIKVETQSSLDDDSHFHGSINNISLLRISTCIIKGMYSTVQFLYSNVVI
jgi:hypothetical protein